VQLRTSIAIAVLAALAAPARANPYETFIDVDSEEDLYDLQATGQIDDDTLAELVEVFQSGVDLNRASREELYSLPNLTYGEVDAIIEYRGLAGWIHEPIDLVVAGILSQEKLESIASFLLISDPTRPLFATAGWVRGQTRFTVDDDGTPPAELQARVATLRNLTVGFAGTLSRNRLTDVEYNPDRDRLMASAADSSVYLPKFYVQWQTDRWGVIAGTYRIGFGQRLTFDNTSLYTPNGFYKDDQLFRETDLVVACRESAGDLDDSPCTGPAASVYETPDYKWREGMLGVAAGFKNLEVGPGTLQSYAFASYQPHSIYQYEIYSPSTCDDPHDTDDECSAPPVYNRQADPDEDTTTWKFQTLPDLFTEMLAGGNVAYSPTRRSHIGVTGYGADVSWAPDGMDLDFQEWSRLPYGGPFGAVGVDGAIGVGMFDVFGEVTRSFDSMPDGDGGGYGAVLREVTNFRKQNELEVSLRYYDQAFKNPYARPIAAPDEFEGARARDEMGARLRYTARLAKRLSLRATADLWSHPSDESTDGLVDVRADLDLTPQFGVGLWNRYVQCLEIALPDDPEEDFDPGLCEGERYQATGRFRFSPTRRATFIAQYQHEYFPDQDRQDSAAAFIATARPWDWLRSRARVRYLHEDITSDEMPLEESLWGYVDTGVRVRERDWLRVRYDVVLHLDDRANTQERVPSPEHWLWLEYESRF
jgi:hypothetical protein